MNKNIGVVLGIIVVVGIAYFVFSRGNTETSEMVKSTPQVTKEAPTKEMPKEQPKVEPAGVMPNAGSYEGYSASKIALAETGKVVLFFHASWCPSCRALNGDIEKNASAIPAGITILKADYDTETEMKKKYGVTTQHTLVQVDKDGNMIKKWSGGSKLENLLSQIQ